MAESRIFTTNDRDPSIAGKRYDEEYFGFSLANATSAAAGSGTTVLLGNGSVVKQSGKVAGFFITLEGPALSASGFVSATVSANLRINSASCLTTLPFVTGPASTSASFTRRIISGKVNPASAAVVPGDILSLDYALNSTGSAAAGAAAIGFTATAIVRYDAI